MQMNKVTKKGKTGGKLYSRYNMHMNEDLNTYFTILFTLGIRRETKAKPE
jgi:hypothetical protein